MNVDFECDVLGLRDDQGQSRLASDFRRRSSIVTRLVDRQATVLLRWCSTDAESLFTGRIPRWAMDRGVHVTLR
jgi:hypothetical protein